MNIEDMKEKLEKILTPKRYIHSLNVMHTAVMLAKIYHEDENNAGTAGLLHDCARDIPADDIISLCEKYDIKPDSIYMAQPKLYHGPIGAILARDEFDVRDENILHAISCHTMGAENMSLLDKIIFIADYIEPDRNFPGANDIREIAYTDIDRAMLLSLERTIKYLMVKGCLIHPDTIIARNNLLLKHDLAYCVF
ncbi:MAG TPA: HD domain-containing protein [Clostridiaceae bacterium]|nr:HD domain-containing protein [Clostridiaceae bacterium]